MERQEIEAKAVEYAVSRGADKDKKAFRMITNRDLYDHTIECFEAGYKKALEERPSDFPSFVNSTELSQKDKDLIKGVYYDWLSFPNPKENA